MKKTDSVQKGDQRANALQPLDARHHGDGGALYVGATIATAVTHFESVKNCRWQKKMSATNDLCAFDSIQSEFILLTFSLERTLPMSELTFNRLPTISVLI